MTAQMVCACPLLSACGFQQQASNPRIMPVLGAASALFVWQIGMRAHLASYFFFEIKITTPSPLGGGGAWCYGQAGEEGIFDPDPQGCAGFLGWVAMRIIWESCMSSANVTGARYGRVQGNNCRGRPRLGPRTAPPPFPHGLQCWTMPSLAVPRRGGPLGPASATAVGPPSLRVFLCLQGTFPPSSGPVPSRGHPQADRRLCLKCCRIPSGSFTPWKAVLHGRTLADSPLSTVQRVAVQIY